MTKVIIFRLHKVAETWCLHKLTGYVYTSCSVGLYDNQKPIFNDFITARPLSFKGNVHSRGMGMGCRPLLNFCSLSVFPVPFLISKCHGNSSDWGYFIAGDMCILDWSQMVMGWDKSRWDLFLSVRIHNRVLDQVDLEWSGGRCWYISLTNNSWTTTMDNLNGIPTLTTEKKKNSKKDRFSRQSVDTYYWKE